MGIVMLMILAWIENAINNILKQQEI